MLLICVMVLERFFFHFSSLTVNYNLAKGAIGKEELSTYVPKK